MDKQSKTVVADLKLTEFYASVLSAVLKYYSDEAPHAGAHMYEVAHLVDCTSAEVADVLQEIRNSLEQQLSPSLP